MWDTHTNTVCYCLFSGSSCFCCVSSCVSMGQNWKTLQPSAGRDLWTHQVHAHMYTHTHAQSLFILRSPSCNSFFVLPRLHCCLQRGAGLPAGIRAGIPSSPSQCLSCREPNRGLRLPWLHLPQTQVLGKEHRSWAQGTHHTGAAQVSVQSSDCFVNLIWSLVRGLHHHFLLVCLLLLCLWRYNEAYTWTNPTCCVHNIIVGQLWIEQYGNVEVINHK